MDWCERRADTKLDASGFEPLQANHASRILYSNETLLIDLLNKLL